MRIEIELENLKYWRSTVKQNPKTLRTDRRQNGKRVKNSYVLCYVFKYLDRNVEYRRLGDRGFGNLRDFEFGR